MKTSIATGSISGELPEKLAAIAAAGFDGIEIFENDFLTFDGSPKEVGNMIRDHGLEISLFQPFRDFEGMPEPQRAQTFDRIERKFDLMQELGADLILICSNASPISLGGIDRAALDFAELGERAAKRGIRVGYEALAWGKHVHDHRDAWEIVRRADHPNIGLILDSFHTLARKIEVESIRSIPADKMFFVQLADAPLIDMDLLYWSRHYRNMPGQGDLPVTQFMQSIAATGYDGTLSLEIFNDQFRGASPHSISVDGHRSLVYLMDQVKRLEKNIIMETPELPDRVTVNGIEFVEFSAGKSEEEQLSTLLTQLGFKSAGKHKSKDVTLWRQGNINILINTETDSFAHSSYLVHGAGVCDIGLSVDNAKRTGKRARALGAKTFTQPVGSGELDIPAIRGVGGSIMHFIDKETDLANIWNVDFDENKAEKSNDTSTVGLCDFDHLAQTMDYDELLTWQLFYNSIFKTQKRPVVDVIDSAGVVRSQAIENENGSLRLTLNGAENSRTLAGRFISDRMGSAVQHIAFTTNDIFKTAAQLKSNGFESLVISPNYYADLQARFNLESDFLNQLKDNNILYDKDEGGEFFQLYSPTFGEGFFFEIVERKSKYTGYGAPNAQFRVAAQRRHVRVKGMPKK